MEKMKMTMLKFKGPAGYMLSQVLNKRKLDDNMQIAQRKYDGKWLLWQYCFDVNPDDSYNEYWTIVGVFDDARAAKAAKSTKITRLNPQ
jgi:hypothetical protein